MLGADGAEGAEGAECSIPRMHALSMSTCAGVQGAPAPNPQPTLTWEQLLIVLPHLKNSLGPLREACKEWRSAVVYALLSLRARIDGPTAESERAGRMAARMPSLHALAVTSLQRPTRLEAARGYTNT